MNSVVTKVNTTVSTPGLGGGGGGWMVGAESATGGSVPSSVPSVAYKTNTGI